MWWFLLLVQLYSCALRITPKYDDKLKNVGNIASSNVAFEYLTKTMNVSANPCKDFFDFSCGNWIANHPSSDKYSQFSIVNKKMLEKMRGEVNYWCTQLSV
ncbi:hypothetical protein ANCCAN_18091 [Ancylostoma caninum]|uniref:Peptidase M13 N-terminal domain-containing protein n=1 Tax=Ancylostoma caninum TaxID=29170 RepID=A0A368FVA9_ANCCA|nr:hypothetical protein ANCCAN_18091 [Ancylostoma caninum]